jgi:hypothetical protein
MRRRNASKASGDAWVKSRCAWGTPVRIDVAVWSLNAHWAARWRCRPPRDVGGALDQEVLGFGGIREAAVLLRQEASGD